MAKNKVHSKEFLKPEMRLPHQTTTFIYKALDIAEVQVKDLFEENEKLRKKISKETIIKRNRKRHEKKTGKIK